MQLTPERALKLLKLRGKFNFNYADVAVVGLLARKILAGEFKPEPSVRFNDTQLEDGLHRCAAVVITDTTVEIATADPKRAVVRARRPTPVWVGIAAAFAIAITLAILTSSGTVGISHHAHHFRLGRIERIDQNGNKHDESEYYLRMKT